MKTILFNDTETSGLALWDKPSTHLDQPRVIQIAAELCVEETGETLAAMNMTIRPDGWVIPELVENLTGITMARAEAFGVPINTALDAFVELWMNSDLRCAHNQPFDMRMIRIELVRDAFYSTLAMQDGDVEIPFADYWKKAPAFCTMASSTSIVNLPPTAKMLAARRTGPKSPNLAEAYKFFTGQELEGAHNAQVDLMALKAIYYGIKKHTVGA
jgi:DNA polymerase-3 subunit epsilon